MNPITTHAEMRLKMRQLRDISGFSQHDMANAIGISQASYHNIEIGKTNIQLTHLEAFSELLGITVGDLLTDPIDDLFPRIRRKIAPPQREGVNASKLLV